MSADRTYAADVALRRLTSFGLDGHDRAIEVAPEVAGEVVDAAVEERLIGVLALAVGAGALVLPEADGDRATELWRTAMAWSMKLEVRLLALASRFSAAGVPMVVLKGPAAAHLDEADPSLRPFADLDLLVPAEGIDAAVHVLADMGATRSWAPRRPRFDAQYAKSVTMRMVDGVEVDLHRMLVDGAFGFRIEPSDVWTRQHPFELGGQRLACLDRPARALHATYHAVLGSPTPRLMSVRDVLGHFTDPRLDPATVVGLADQWRGRAVLHAGLELVEAVTGVRPAGYEPWRNERIAEAERRLVERQRAEGSSLGRAKVDALRELRWGARPGYALALAVPSRAHLQSRGLRRRDLLRRAS